MITAIMSPLTRLREVERADVMIVMENFVDVLLAGSEDVRRYVQHDVSDRKQLIAEHGLGTVVRF